MPEELLRGFAEGPCDAEEQQKGEGDLARALEDRVHREN